MNKKLTIGLTSLVLAGTLGFGAIASAAGSGSGSGTDTGTPRPKLTTQQKCDKSDEVVTKLTTTQSKIAERTTALQTKRAAAEAAGKTDAVARIDKRLARLDKINTRITNRLAKIDTWVTANCTA